MTPNTIEVITTHDNTWVMRITADRRIEVNEDVDVTYAAQKVLDAMQYMLQKREWVGLTEEDFVCVNQTCRTPIEGAEYALFLLKEKNHAT